MLTAPKRFRDLEAAIDGVVATYTGALEIDNLESAALPNKRAAIDAFGHLKSAIFVGFYATRSLNRDNLRQTIAEHLYAAHHALVDQIERALTYEHRSSQTPCPLRTGSGEDVVLALFADIPELRRLLNADVLAAYNGDPAASSVEEIVFSYPSIEAIVAYRIANRLYRAGVPMVPRILTEHAHSLTGIDLSPGATIGERFFIDHGTGVVVGETSRIGNDVKIYQGVTLGALSVPHRSETPRQRHPTIEDGVTIYAGATILGGETVIGARSIIGGNVWLTSSVPPDSKVLGRSRDETRPTVPPRGPDGT
jgi:serine O-acetyltransferase